LFLPGFRKKIGNIQGRALWTQRRDGTDVGAEERGIGWIGKIACSTAQWGVFSFWPNSSIDLELNMDGPVKSYCGPAACMDACPQLLCPEPYVVDGANAYPIYHRVKEEFQVRKREIRPTGFWL